MIIKQFTVVAYDIRNNKRRSKVAKILEGFGERVNYSVFECMLTPKQSEEMIRQLSEVILPSSDSILLYTLCRTCIPKRHHIGLAVRGLDMVIVV